AVALDDVSTAAARGRAGPGHSRGSDRRAGSDRRGLAGGLRCLLEVALATVFLERHRGSPARRLGRLPATDRLLLRLALVALLGPGGPASRLAGAARAGLVDRDRLLRLRGPRVRGGLDARLERGHEVDELRALFRLGQADRLAAFDLLLDDLHERL